MYKLADIKVVQFEISNYCNASCPQCPRNFYGGKTVSTLPLAAWRLDEFKKIYSQFDINNIEHVYFCGSYGDPLTNKNIVDICEYVRENSPNAEIGIHTNGGVGASGIYEQLAKTVSYIAFGIDGLQDTNHLYRKGVQWKKLLKNVKSFIDCGGTAYWDYIVFEHNQHQVEQAKSFAEKLGFKKFSIKKTSRFFNKKHEFTKTTPVYNRQGYIDYTIKIPTDKNYINNGYDLINDSDFNVNSYSLTTKIKCNAIRINEVYIGADGFVFPCGWLHDRLYGVESENHEDYIKIKKLMSDAGGWHKANIFHTSMLEIVEGKWFDIIKQSWSNQNRLYRCGIMCGEKLNLIGIQNSDIIYKQ